MADYIFPPLALDVRTESFPLLVPFSIARGTKTTAEVVVVEVHGQGQRGRGESVPYARYGETMADSIKDILTLREKLGQGISLATLETLLPAGAARNAVDCALWDWRSRYEKTTISSLTGLPVPQDMITAFTISLDSPEMMAKRAADASHMPLLKLKLGKAKRDADRINAVRLAAPKSRLVIDANEGWSLDDLARLAPVAEKAGVELIEQPLPAGQDHELRTFSSPVPLCADESFSGERTFDDLAHLYQAVNLKLDKTGGFTTACTLAHEAKALDLDLFVGCMVASSLAMAPACHLASLARWVDLDGPLLLASDRRPGLEIVAGRIQNMPSGLWGYV